MRCATLRWGSWIISGISSGQGSILCGTRLSAGNVFRNASTIANRISYSRLTLRQCLSEDRYGDCQYHRNHRGHRHQPLQNDALHNAPLFRDRATARLFFDCGSIIRLVREQDTHECAISVQATTSWVSKRVYA